MRHTIYSTKALIFISLFLLTCMVNAQHLHVEGKARVDDQLTVADSSGINIFEFDPNAQSFTFRDTGGQIIYQISVGGQQTLQPKPNNRDLKAQNTNDPLKEVVVEGTKVITTERNGDGQVVKRREFDSGGATGSSTNTVQEFNPETGKKTEEVTKTSGSITTTKFDMNEMKYSETVEFPNREYHHKRINPENGNLEFEDIGTLVNGSINTTRVYYDDQGAVQSKKEIDEAGNVKIFDKNGNLIKLTTVLDQSKDEYTDPTNGFIARTSANGSFFDNGSGNTGNIDHNGGTWQDLGGNQIISNPLEMKISNTGGNNSVVRADAIRVEDASGNSSSSNSTEKKVSDGSNEAKMTANGINTTTVSTGPGGNINTSIGGNGLIASNIPFTLGMLFDFIAGKIDFINPVNVIGELTASVKNFKIDHPLNPDEMYLQHASIEAPEMINLYCGNATTDAQGLVTIQLPSYFMALNTSFKYQLTTIGSFSRVTVEEEISNNQFVIRTEEPNVKVSWQVTGVRIDKWALENPMVVELSKSH